MPQGLFGGSKIFVGVVHLPPLPGSPRWEGDMAKILSQATPEETQADRWRCGRDNNREFR
ncbi:MAG: hypothetical protein CM1200mP35_10490 [Chloroflexota bacterium]|nr:MAG: hypothetical protein CM1200mP35_10490 [Chloroflexota bacterium]